MLTSITGCRRVAGIPETQALALPCCLLLASGAHSTKEGGTCDKGRSLVAVSHCCWLSGAEDERSGRAPPWEERTDDLPPMRVS